MLREILGAFTILVGTLLVWLLVSTVSGIIRNYQKVRHLGIPIVIAPISFFNPVWALTNTFVYPLYLQLPFGLDYWFRFIDVDWTFRDGVSSHEKHGGIFVIVNSRDVQFNVADADALEDVATRRKDFTKPEGIYSSMEFFGRNVDTVEGATWQRHRKITTPPFNERNSRLVWDESLRQAREMIETWDSQFDGSVRTTTKDTMTLALHVLTSAGFGFSYSFSENHIQTLPDGHELSYRDALHEVLSSFMSLVIFNHDHLRSKWMPSSLRRSGLAAAEFRQYMMETIERERSLVRSSLYRPPNQSSNLVSALIRASEEGKTTTNDSLSDSEIMGNLFLYNLAGHETTANMLAYSIYLLSINPHLQEWLHEEICAVLGWDSNLLEWSYTSSFPKLKRCLAILYETLRQYAPVISLPRHTESTPQALTVEGKMHVIPAGSFVSLNLIATHTWPRYWGEDAGEWKPTRWIDSPLSSVTNTTSSSSTTAPSPPPPSINTILENESLKPPPKKHSFRPWFEGPRVCPGKKFAQVEFVAVLAVLFRDWKVSVKPEPVAASSSPSSSSSPPLESPTQTKQRVMNVIRDSRVKITLQMQKPTRVGLVWERR